MVEIIISVLAIYLLVIAIKLALKIAWGATKIIATIILILSVPIFFICLISAGGVILLFPVALIAGAIGLLKVC